MDYHLSSLSEADKALLDFAVKLGVRFAEFSRQDILNLQTFGFSEEQILEFEVVVALNNFANTLQMGLAIVPDFESPLVLGQNKVYLPAATSRPIERGFVTPSLTEVQDPDARLVAEARGGKPEAFEELVRRHSQLIYRALVAILGDPVEAQDAMQDALLSAFKHIAGFAVLIWRGSQILAESLVDSQRLPSCDSFLCVDVTFRRQSRPIPAVAGLDRISADQVRCRSAGSPFGGGWPGCGHFD